MFRALQATGSVVGGAASRGLSTSSSASKAPTMEALFSGLPKGVKYAFAVAAVAEAGSMCYLYFNVGGKGEEGSPST